MENDHLIQVRVANARKLQLSSEALPGLLVNGLRFILILVCAFDAVTIVLVTLQGQPLFFGSDITYSGTMVYLVLSLLVMFTALFGYKKIK